MQLLIVTMVQYKQKKCVRFPYVHRKTCQEAPDAEYRNSSALSSTSTLDAGGWSLLRPCHFTPGKKTRYPFYGRMDESQGQSGQVRKISPPPGFDSRIVQSLASRYSDYATRPTTTEVPFLNTLRTGDSDLRFYITTVQDG